jgi:hypothetical protein
MLYFSGHKQTDMKKIKIINDMAIELNGDLYIRHGKEAAMPIAKRDPNKPYMPTIRHQSKKRY